MECTSKSQGLEKLKMESGSPKILGFLSSKKGSLGKLAGVSKIKISIARPLHAVIVNTLVHEFCEFESDDCHSTVQSVRTMLALKTMRAFLAYSDGALAGFVLLQKDYDPWEACFVIRCEILFVREKFRACGIGAELMRCMDEHTIESGAKFQEWEVWEHMENLVRIYDRVATRLTGWLTYRAEITTP